MGRAQETPLAQVVVEMTTHLHVALATIASNAPFLIAFAI
jgi:hypothetical protein